VWLVVGVLLGVVVLSTVLGGHVGPHAHLVAGAAGAAAAGCLVALVVGGAPALAGGLLAADLTALAGVGAMAVHARRQQASLPAVPARPVDRLEAAEGRALTDLDPVGIVVVHGEEWSAVALNPPVRAGGRVQVIESGVRLEVYGVDPPELLANPGPDAQEVQP
jgi:membrane-bound ClpP family serine protease